MNKQDMDQVVKTFYRYINRGQVNCLKAGHLDVLETPRQSVRFIDPISGTVMIDCFTSAGFFNVGRRNPVIINAIEEALETLDMGSYNLTSPRKIALAREFRILKR